MKESLIVVAALMGMAFGFLVSEHGAVLHLIYLTGVITGNGK
jgi:hypothetical protein